MKDLILTKSIGVVTATLTAALIMWSVALILPAAAQNRLAENPDIHDSSKWTKFHNWARGQPKSEGVRVCHSLCQGTAHQNSYYSLFPYMNEQGKCEYKYRKTAYCGTHHSSYDFDRCNAIKRDCDVLRAQCVSQECTLYGY